MNWEDLIGQGFMVSLEIEGGGTDCVIWGAEHKDGTRDMLARAFAPLPSLALEQARHQLTVEVVT